MWIDFVIHGHAKNVSPLDTKVAVKGMLPSDRVLIVNGFAKRVVKFLRVVNRRWSEGVIIAFEPSEETFFNNVISRVGISWGQGLSQKSKRFGSVGVVGAPEEVDTTLPLPVCSRGRA